MYSITELGTLIPDAGNPGKFLGNSVARAINNHGHVVGWSDTVSGKQHAFLWRRGKMHDLGTLIPDPPNPGIFLGRSEAIAINDAGDVVGFSEVEVDGNRHGVLWSGGTMTDLEPFEDYTGSVANGINHAGRIVGSCFLPNGSGQAFLWSPKTGMQLLGLLDPLHDQWSEALGINGAGKTVGLSGGQGFFAEDGVYNRAFLWSFLYFLGDRGVGAMFDLGAGGQNKLYVRANAINNQDEVVGVADDRPVLWTSQFGMTYLGSSPNTKGVVYAINDQGTMVGTSHLFDPTGRLRATRFLHLGPPIDLNTLIPPNSGWHLERALGVNNSGGIVGEGLINGHTRAFLIAEAVKAAPFAVREVEIIASVMKVIYGIIADSGGLGIGPQGPVPFPPGNPWAGLTSGTRDELIGLTLRELAQLIDNPRARQELLRIAATLEGRARRY